MTVNTDLIKKLRNKTNAGVLDCKKALENCNDDINKAVDWLRQKGLAIATKRTNRVANEGQIIAYIHTGNKLGVLVEINSETDFVSKTEEFTQFAKNISIQIAATNPLCISEEEIPHDIIERERQIYLAQIKELGKPEKIWEKIIEGKIKTFINENTLLKQLFVKDLNKTIEELLNEIRIKTGENIQIRRFTRFQLGEIS